MEKPDKNVSGSATQETLLEDPFSFPSLSLTSLVELSLPEFDELMDLDQDTQTNIEGANRKDVAELAASDTKFSSDFPNLADPPAPQIKKASLGQAEPPQSSSKHGDRSTSCSRL